MSEISLILQC